MPVSDLIFITQFLKNYIMGYFQRWKLSVMKRPGFTDDEKRMMISQETLDGITVTSECTLLTYVYMYFRKGPGISPPPARFSLHNHTFIIHVQGRRQDY